jgi:hypothetical protein
MMLRSWHRRSRVFLQYRLLWVLFACLTWCSVTRAEAPRVLVVTDPDLPSELEKAAIGGLESLGNVFANPSEYTSAARAQRLKPTSEAALTRIAPKGRARLIVTLEVARGKLQVSYRDGSNGSVVSKQKLPARSKNPKFAKVVSRKVAAAARKAIAKLPPEPPRAIEEKPLTASTGPSSAERRAAMPARPAYPVTSGSSESSYPATPSYPAAASPATPQPSAAEEDADAEGGDESEQDEDEEQSANADDGPSEGMKFRISAGAGAGARSLYVPRRVAGSQLDTGLGFPALEISAGLQGMLSAEFLLSAEISYRTVFGLQSVAMGSAPRSVSSHSIVIGAAPGYRFGGQDGGDFRVFLGFSYRSLTPENTSMPSDTAYGLVVRPELRLPIGGGFLTLKLAPELIVAFGIDASFRRTPVPGLSPVGVGVGGEVALEMRLVDPVYLGLAYRESHIFVGSNLGSSFTDMERYLIVRGVVRF